MRQSFIYRGLKLSYLDSGGKDRKIVLIAHANGYSAGCYRYYIEALRHKFRVIALDFAGCGCSEVSLVFDNWLFFRDQLIALAQMIRGQSDLPCYAIGHSLGGYCAISAAASLPGLFDRVIALDPVLLNVLSISFGSRYNPLARAAEKRRSQFKSLELVRRAYRRLPQFAYWQEEIFDDYLQSCLRKSDDQFELCCNPTLEAKIFRSISLREYRRIYTLNVPTMIIIPKQWNVCSPRKAAKVLHGRNSNRLLIVDQLSHFFPFEKPDWTLEKIKEFLSVKD